eukprot:CAMPEP_0173275126 /NCGR_PEP_ID=MMETSP1143-20121109/2813_1 /TAXON_ID=483371 /ORGANISM="non described non described, Strain CCMP2298" /LENGTH=102 /DNA_ID=CAMNT_0014211995 /DNA_START=293 /DNA_END=597 /DNA_ORIENTATION=-
MSDCGSKCVHRAAAARAAERAASVVIEGVVRVRVGSAAPPHRLRVPTAHAIAQLQIRPTLPAHQQLQQRAALSGQLERRHEQPGVRLCALELQQLLPDVVLL